MRFVKGPVVTHNSAPDLQGEERDPTTERGEAKGIASGERRTQGDELTPLNDWENEAWVVYQ